MVRSRVNWAVPWMLMVACPGDGPGPSSDSGESSSTGTPGTSTATGTTNPDATTEAPTSSTTGSTTDPTTGSTTDPTTGTSTSSTTDAAETGEATTATTSSTTDPPDPDTTAQPSNCGDGIEEPGEQCDDGNDLDSDDCTSACKLAACGDGFVHEGVEACDDGDASAQCDADCSLPACGDEQVNQSAGEQCDDGGASPACDGDCSFAACGDGTLNQAAGEQCDDGNVVAQDGCSAECTIEAEAALMVVGYAGTGMVFADGSFRRWGKNDLGQLGYGHLKHLGDDPGELPTPILPVGGPVLQASSGKTHTCAVVAGGDLHCWGKNQYGALGSESTETLGDKPGELPTAPVDVGAPVVQVSASDEHTCVVTQAGGVRCFGAADRGQLGYADIPWLGALPGEMPPPDVALGGPAIEVATGLFHTCAILQGGAVKCWGYGPYGELGYGLGEKVGDDPGEMPSPDVPLGGPATHLALGDFFSCALMQGGAVKCWGRNDEGQLGQGHKNAIGDQVGEMPPPDVDVGGVVVQLGVGLKHACVVLDTGKLRCWGSTEYGAVGYPNVSDVGDAPGEMPPPDVDIGGTVAALAVHRSFHSCVLFVDKTMRCWGYNENGAYGTGGFLSYGDNEVPALAPLVPY